MSFKILLLLVVLISCSPPQKVVMENSELPDSLLVMTTNYKDWSQIDFLSRDGHSYNRKLFQGGNYSLSSLAKGDFVLFDRQGRGGAHLLEQETSISRMTVELPAKIQGMKEINGRLLAWVLGKCHLVDTSNGKAVIDFSDLDNYCQQTDIFSMEKVRQLFTWNDIPFLVTNDALIPLANDIINMNSEQLNFAFKNKISLSIQNPLMAHHFWNNFLILGEAGDWNVPEQKSLFEIFSLNQTGEIVKLKEFYVESKINAKLLDFIVTERGEVYFIAFGSESILGKFNLSNLIKGEDVELVVLKKDSGYAYNSITYSKRSNHIYLGTQKQGILIFNLNEQRFKSSYRMSQIVTSIKVLGDDEE